MGRPLVLFFLVLCSAVACGDDDPPSDEDLIQKLIEDVTGEVDGTYVKRCLAYVDMQRYPLDVKVPRHSGVYDAERAPQIEKRFRDIIRQRFQGTEIRLRNDEVEIDGDRAEVRLALITAVGPLRVELTVQKPEPGVWKISRVHIRR
ncbi:MAG: hypothetical protein PVI30_13275 [Myxococcales bacterium]|jgi:hypothetical protein